MGSSAPTRNLASSAAEPIMSGISRSPGTVTSTTCGCNCPSRSWSPVSVSGASFRGRGGFAEPPRTALPTKMPESVAAVAPNSCPPKAGEFEKAHVQEENSLGEDHVGNLKEHQGPGRRSRSHEHPRRSEYSQHLRAAAARTTPRGREGDGGTGARRGERRSQAQQERGRPVLD